MTAISPTASREEELEEATKSFLKDSKRERTYGRRVATWLKDRFPRWYMGKDETSRDIDDGPSLEKAWAFYEHVTLQRHIVEETRGL